jgi:TPR repeat protein
MMRFWQAAVFFLMGIAHLGAQEAPKSFAWLAPKIVTSIFTHDLGMLDSEREEYATNLARLASNQVAAAKATPASLADARRILALALQLSPRNRLAVVVNFQFSKGLLPEAAPASYSQQVFARLILTRGQLLAKQGGEQNQKLARYFIQLAAELDPKNEDAVYASELQRLDHGTLDWSAVTDPAPAKQP